MMQQVNAMDMNTYLLAVPGLSICVPSMSSPWLCAAFTKLVVVVAFVVVDVITICCGGLSSRRTGGGPTLLCGTGGGGLSPWQESGD